jgi:hypothetical protein
LLPPQVVQPLVRRDKPAKEGGGLGNMEGSSRNEGLSLAVQRVICADRGVDGMRAIGLGVEGARHR